METPTPYKGKEPYVFISYAHKDKTAVFPVISRMQAAGYRVWFDKGIDPGSEWDEMIARHVEGCGCFIAFLSKNYLASSNCKDELNYARDLEKNRLLVYLEDVTLPAGMAMRLNRLQAIFMHRYEKENEFYETLFSAQGLETCRGEGAAPQKRGKTKYDEPSEPALSAEEAYRKGEAYTYGRDVPQDYATAVKYYRIAADQGHAKAQSYLGICYETGKGVPQNYGEALKYYRIAADQGDTLAQTCLGLCYEFGKGVPQNYGEALKYYRMAADLGNTTALIDLGRCYELGKGMPANRRKAIEYYRLAAKKGNPRAITELKRLGVLR